MEVKIEVKPRLINANALMEYCRNQKSKTVDCNDIARFPTYPTQETDKDIIINFLKKELIKKTYCRQVMKRQYRELKQKYDALLGDFNLMESCNNCKHHHVGGCPYAQTKDCNWKNKKHWELCK